QAGRDADHRGLACAIGPKRPDHSSLIDGDREAIERDPLTELFGDAAQLDEGCPVDRHMELTPSNRVDDASRQFRRVAGVPARTATREDHPSLSHRPPPTFCPP